MYPNSFTTRISEEQRESPPIQLLLSGTQTGERHGKRQRGLLRDARLNQHWAGDGPKLSTDRERVGRDEGVFGSRVERLIDKNPTSKHGEMECNAFRRIYKNETCWNIQGLILLS